MRRFLMIATAAATVAGCDFGPTEADLPVLEGTDYSILLFGDAGAAMESLMGPQGAQPFDGRSHGMQRLPEELRLSDAQKAEITALRQGFRTANADQLAALRAVMERAKAAREAGQTREELRAIRLEARPIAQSLRPAVQALHAATMAVLTDAQRAWLAENRPGRRGPG